MGFNYAKEKEKFDREWDKLRKEYSQAGMSEESIQEMYNFDLDTFRSQRTYSNRTQRMPDTLCSSSDENERSRLFRKFDGLTTSPDERGITQNWIDLIEDPRLIKGLKRLSQDDIELLVQLVLLEYSQRELAKILGCNKTTLARRFEYIKKRFM